MVQTDKNISKKLTIFVGTASFILAIIGLYFFFKINGVETMVSAILSVVSAGIVVSIILGVSKIIREFTVKGGTFEFSAKLQEIQTEVKESKRDLGERISNLYQSIQNIQTMQSINKLEVNLHESKGELKKTLNESGISTKEVEPEKKISPESTEKIDVLIARIKTLEEAVGKSLPLNIEETMQRANYYFYKKKFKKALEIYERILDEDVDNTTALFNKAYCLDELGRHMEAIEWYGKLLKISDTQEAKYNTGQAYVALKDYDKAFEWYEKALEKNPHYTNAMSGKGYVLIKKGDYVKARDLYQEVLKIDSNDANAKYNLACIDALEGHVDNAIVSLESAIKLDSKYKERAKSDPDFDNMRDNPTFLKLLT